MSGRHRQSPPPRTRPGQGRHRKPARRARFVLPTVAAVGVLGVGGVSAAAVFTGSSSGTDARAPVASPRAESAVHLPSSTAAPVPVTPTSASPSPAVPNAHVRRAVAANPHLLSLTTVGRLSWVRVVGPRGRVLFMGMLRHGKTLRFTARPLSVTLGDAGAVRVQHGATIFAHAGRNGQVRTFHVTS